ncbi:MAG TPA: hypothetical protein VGQ35_21160 [Dongiaceae bacterium]|jgi:hypothetical protein|nr:hypothetical protein [Dongiaceae bacterium]
MRVASDRKSARRHRASLAAATLLAILAAGPAFAGQPTPPAQTVKPFQPSAYELARLRAGQSWDSGELSITELRPGTVEQGNFEKYIAEVGSNATEVNPTLELLAALGPQIVTDDGDILTLQTASASWGEPGIIPRSHMSTDGVWEFPRLPTQDEQDMLVGQRWRVVESIESQMLFLGPDRRFGWDDFADLVNPLQHIPLINIAYRAATGDKIYGAASLLDMGFGPIAGAGTVFQLAYQSTTGDNLEDKAVAAVFGPRSVDDTAGLYTTASEQLADREALRRGSNQ